jgi:hypothetical protein
LDARVQQHSIEKGEQTQQLIESLKANAALK